MALRLNQGYLKIRIPTYAFTIRFFRLPWDSIYYDEVVIRSDGRVYVNGAINRNYDISWYTYKDGYVYLAHEVGEIEQILITDKLASDKMVADWHESLVYFYADEEFLENPAPYNVAMEVS